MLVFRCENSDTQCKKLPGILTTIMLSSLLYFKYLVPWIPKVRYSRHYMLAFYYSGLLILHIVIYQWRINSLHSMLDPLFSQRFDFLIKISKRWNEYPTWYVNFPLEIHQFKIKEFTKHIANNYVCTSVFFLKL